MSTQSKYCPHCADRVETKITGRETRCARCGALLGETPVDSEPIGNRPAGYGTAPSRTKPIGNGWR